MPLESFRVHWTSVSVLSKWIPMRFRNIPDERPVTRLEIPSIEIPDGNGG